MVPQSKVDTGSLVTALFHDAEAVERAYDVATRLGYEKSDISLLMSEESRQRHFADSQVGAELADKAKQSTENAGPDVTELGGPVGGTLGTVAPVAAAVGAAMLLPGLVFAGPIAVALAAAGAVGVAGGIVGALVNWGIPKNRVKDYETEIRDGGILMGVKARSEEDARGLSEEWRKAGGTFLKR